MTEDDLSRLVSLRHSDPHSLLGIHPAGSGLVLRVFRPEATQVLAIEADRRVALHLRPDRPGIFEARWPLSGELADDSPRPSYELEVTGPTQTATFRDPYSFEPTLGEQDLHFVGEGRHRRLWERLGARPIRHQGVDGTAFAVWAPNAEGVSVVGDFNLWDGRVHQMRSMGASGIWELFVPNVAEGARYKFELRSRDKGLCLKADPFAFRTEVPPQTASVVQKSRHRWGDARWLEQRLGSSKKSAAMSIYEVHLASWRRVPEEGNRSLTYRELAAQLPAYVKSLGFTHVEFLPVAEHPFGGSWGYQVSSYYAPTSRFGTPDDFRFLVDALHQAGLAVIIDWVPGHFPRDTWALAQFDGTSLYEHADPRRGAHPDWGTLIFNFGRNEVRNFLIANALFWVEEFHVDGLRVDAVASMLYLDYSREPGEWLPNRFGGRENEEAIGFLRELNETLGTLHPDVMVMAEESTSWPQVSRSTSQGGLGFTHKWNMGWMHDTLSYFQKDPVHRRFHHHQLTFGLLYAFAENFVLPISHDEVVHGKRSLVSKMPGDDWQKFANLRALLGLMWAHPGKKLLFMGQEFAQWNEWNADASLDWHLLQYDRHQTVQALVARLNALYATEGALFETDFWHHGFQWVQADSADANVYAFIRRGHNAWREVVCVANLSPVVRHAYRIGVPSGGYWAEILNTDSTEFGGSGVTNAPQLVEKHPWDHQPGSLTLQLPPLAVLWLAPVDHPSP